MSNIEIPMVLVNTSAVNVTWTVAVDGVIKHKVTQPPGVYSGLSVDHGPVYDLDCNGAKAQTNNPNSVNVFDGAQVSVTVPL